MSVCCKAIAQANTARLQSGYDLLPPWLLMYHTGIACNKLKRAQWWLRELSALTRASMSFILMCACICPYLHTPNTFIPPETAPEAKSEVSVVTWLLWEKRRPDWRTAAISTKWFLFWQPSSIGIWKDKGWSCWDQRDSRNYCIFLLPGVSWES